MTRSIRYLLALASVLLVLTISQSPLVAAEAKKSWNISGAEIDDDVLFDEEYIRARIEDSKRAVIESINYRYVDGEFQSIAVEPVEFSNMFVSANRFVGFPIVCGSYRSSGSETTYRFVFLAPPFTFVEESANDFESSWKTHCERA